MVIGTKYKVLLVNGAPMVPVLISLKLFPNPNKPIKQGSIGLFNVSHKEFCGNTVGKQL